MGPQVVLRVLPTVSQVSPTVPLGVPVGQGCVHG
jgi:hypothetical protein